MTLSKEIELLTFIIDVCKMGHGKTKREVIDIIRRTVKKKKEKEGKDFGKCKFNGEGWWQGFIQRHSKLSLHTSDALSYCQSNAVDKERLEYYFSLLKRTLEDNNLMNKACYIYNMDETTSRQNVLLQRVSKKFMDHHHETKVTILAWSNAVKLVLYYHL